ncbi:TetR family transcriptional regulator [Kribbella deserti]|uniref:TetR family transcriptional regulator n=1 Tax=Kribbella deserti TaxID=1926257 RepID=A0ABV6QSI7_9ACTN
MTELGRRERKKQLTRQAISDVATRLFMARGFDGVTVAEVAAAADVAVQTVFNHFPTKEDLFFDDASWVTGPAEAIRTAPPGEPPLATLLRHYLAAIRQRHELGYLATWPRFNQTIEGSSALLARVRQNAQTMEDLLAEALLERDAAMSPLIARLVAAQYGAAQKVLEQELARLMPAEEASARQLARATKDLEKAIDEVFAALGASGAEN